MTDKAWLSRSSYVYDCSTVKEGIVHDHDEEEECFLLELLYESSTPILYKEVSSTIFQSLWVSESGIGNTCPDLHFVQYIKA